ncbi:MAG: alpha/beta fold hydrolase [Hellea sp.]
MLVPDPSLEHVVFLPGFMCDARLFAPQTDALSSIDLPYSIDLMTQSATIRDIALDVLRASPKRFALAGLSMGGIVAMEVMRLAPQRVSHLALLNTTPYEDRSSAQRRDHMQRVRNGEMTDILRDELKPKYLSPSAAFENLLPLITKMGEGLGADVFVQQSLALMTRKSAMSSLASIACPAAIITGADDLICPPSIHADMQKLIDGSDLHIIENCGHLSTLEAPDKINHILLEHWGLCRKAEIAGLAPKTPNTANI